MTFDFACNRAADSKTIMRLIVRMLFTVYQAMRTNWRQTLCVAWSNFNESLQCISIRYVVLNILFSFFCAIYFAGLANSLASAKLMIARFRENNVLFSNEPFPMQHISQSRRCFHMNCRLIQRSR